MRSALLTNSATAAAKAVPNPNINQVTSGQVVSSHQLNTEQNQANAILSKNRTPEIPKKTDGIFENEESDTTEDGVSPESIEELKFKKTRKLLTVA